MRSAASLRAVRHQAARTENLHPHISCASHKEWAICISYWKISRPCTLARRAHQAFSYRRMRFFCWLGALPIGMSIASSCLVNEDCRPPDCRGHFAEGW
jgi:hypothetical protein